MFTKRPGELTPEDIQRVVDENVPEGGEVEFKEGLSTKDGQAHPWTTGGDQIGDRARNELLAEVVAFANAYGGWLVVGIRETAEKPARADEVVPIRACADLAERLRLMCRDCIEPRLPVLDAEGVMMRDDGAGVVVFRVPRSRMAPHRLEPTRECYRRHADRTEKMTMREIQDLTLQVERGMAAVDARFRDRQERFAIPWSEFVADAPRAFGLRATLVPLVPVYVERVYNNLDVLPPAESLVLTPREGRPFSIDLYMPRYWRPVLRGAASIDDNNRQAVFCDGVIEYSIMVRQQGSAELVLHPSEPMAVAANALLAAERFRRAAGVPDAEYALEIEIKVHRLPVLVSPYDSGWLVRQPMALSPPGELFPRYPVGPREEFGRIWSLIERDFWNAAGVDPGEGAMTIDFDRAFRALGL